MSEFSKYVGLDVHKESVSITVADKGRGKPRYFGEIVNSPESIKKLVSQLSTDGEVMSFCYEAGPYGNPRSCGRPGHYIMSHASLQRQF